MITMADKDYVTISERKACETVIKGSRFIGVAVPIHDEDCLRAALTSISKEFPEATHYCYGAVFGGSDRTERSSDNGEPSGTAGRPIVNVIRGSGLTDVAVMVIRYFGGTLLGTGGLTHAYSSSASSVLSMCQTIERKVCGRISVTVPYADYDRFEHVMSTFFHSLPRKEFGADVIIRGSVPKDSVDDFIDTLREQFGGRLTATVDGYGYD